MPRPSNRRRLSVFSDSFAATLRDATARLRGCLAGRRLAWMKGGSMLYRISLLALAGVAGTLFRYWVSGWFARRFGEFFPVGTLVVNLTGCFTIGLLYHLFEERLLVDPLVRTAILIGFLGAFTTFSSLGLQTFALLRDGEFLVAGVYLGISNVAGILLVWMGYALSRLMTETLQ